MSFILLCRRKKKSWVGENRKYKNSRTVIDNVSVQIILGQYLTWRVFSEQLKIIINIYLPTQSKPTGKLVLTGSNWSKLFFRNIIYFSNFYFFVYLFVYLLVRLLIYLFFRFSLIQVVLNVRVDQLDSCIDNIA